MTELDSIQHADLFDLCDQLDAASIDMILCDLPYGTTACSWDTVIPFAPMWERFKRVIKPRGAIVLTASQPFTSALVMSNVEMYRHEWIWNKVTGRGLFNAKTQPLKAHESVLIFGFEGCSYYPEMRPSDPRNRRDRIKNATKGYEGGIYGNQQPFAQTKDETERYPISVISIANQADELHWDKRLHPTQKPVALFRYLIRTYTQPGDVVLDPCVGSGTTALAAREEQRHWICGDSSPEYVEIAQRRMDAPYTLPLFKEVKP